jgi:chromosome segregation ATPase
LNDYESKISEIEEHVKKGDEEIAKLKEAAEAKYIHKYLSELESIGGQYKSSLSHIIKTDKEIEAEMEKAKDRISELLSSSQKIVRRVGEQVDKSPDYDTVRKRVEERTARLKKTVEEKAREKGNLSDEIKKKKKKK